MWIWIIVVIVVITVAILGCQLPPVPGVTGPCEPSKRERQDEQDRLTYEQSEQIKGWAKELLAIDKHLNNWQKGFLTKISRTRLNLTERQGDKVHEIYEEYLG